MNKERKAFRVWRRMGGRGVDERVKAQQARR